MKNADLVAKLELTFKWLGYLFFVGTLFGIYTSIKRFTHMDFVQHDGVTPANTELVHVLPQVRVLVDLMTNGFFLLLVSHVFSLIRGGSEHTHQYGFRLMTVTCVGFVLQALIGFSSAIYALVKFPKDALNATLDYLLFATSFLTSLGYLIPILYALTIFVLYRHFVGMIKFESEVV